MKKIFILCGAVLLACTSISAQKKEKAPSLAEMIVTQTDTLAYAMGQQIPEGLRHHLLKENIIKENPDNDPKIEKANNLIIQELQKGLQGGLESLTPMQQAYVIGASMGQNIKPMIEGFEKEFLSNGETIDKTIVIQSIIENISGREAIVPNSNMILEKIVTAKQEEQNKIKQAEQNKLKESKQAEEDAFLLQNMQQEGIISLPNGLQYKIITVGTGEKPTKDSKVTVHYEGRMLDGTVFDSSIERGTPASFPVSGVIRGWTEILQEMPVGSKWTVYIPQELAYGANGAGAIPPFSTLVFDIELISID